MIWMAVAEPKLSRERIFTTALDLIEKTGVSTLTMRSLSRALGVGTMSLYVYVRTKDEILDGIGDHAIEAWHLTADQTKSWDEQVIGIFVEIERQLEAQPGVLELLLLRSVEGASVNAVRDTVITIFLNAGFPPDQALRALGMLYAHTLGFAATAHRAGRDAHEFENLPPSSYPHLSQVAGHYDSRATPEAFRTGLRYLLAGLTADRPDVATADEAVRSATAQ
jgi:AcrR family transcriptional regulator